MCDKWGRSGLVRRPSSWPVITIRLLYEGFFDPSHVLVVSTAVVRRGGGGQSGKFRSQFLRRHDLHRRSPGKQVPAHLLHAAGEEALSMAETNCAK